jgi:predicted DNA binding protein
MALIGKVVTHDQPGQEALEAVPDMPTRLEDARSGPNGTLRVIYWATGDDFETYENTMADDRDIVDYDCLTEVPDRRLYRITLAEDASQRVVHPVVVEHDITLLELTLTADRMRVLARFPSREALSAFRNACRERDMEFHLEQLYEEESVTNDGGVENGTASRSHSAMRSSPRWSRATSTSPDGRRWRR